MSRLVVKAAKSMWYSPLRMPGRSWSTELCMRAVRELFVAGNTRPLSWLRRQMNASVVPHPSMLKTHVTQHSLAGVPVTMAAPQGPYFQSKIIIYLHGGGYVSGSPASHRALISQLAINSNCLVIAPDYRLAPEHAFPIPQDDCLAVAKAVAEIYSGAKLVLAGDSAGGALAVTTAIDLARLHDSGEVPNSASKLVLISPWVDPTDDTGTMQSNASNDVFRAEFLQQSYQALMQDDARLSVRVKVLDADLHRLPHTLIQCGTGELLYDQIQAFNLAARQAGVVVQMENYTGQFHDFQMFSPLLADARRAMQSIARFIG